MPESISSQDTPATDQPVRSPESDSVNAALQLSDEAVSHSGPFIGRWNQLVSTTNWEKGRIIADWREALLDSGAAITEYSDEAWAQLVGQVTGQHVGRLRRVHERFGAAREGYEGLFWSHFQAALDWEDAEMWLEGAITNKWSVAKMRAARWEAVGAPDGVGPDEHEVIQAELDEDSYQALTEGSVASGETANSPAPGATTVEETHRETHEQFTEESDGSVTTTDPQDKSQPTERIRPFEALAELPDDVAVAFEQMKLAILTHKLSNWESISRDDLVAAIDALRSMALAPSDE